MKDTIEVLGKKYEQCTYREWTRCEVGLVLSNDADDNYTYYKQVKDPFSTHVDGMTVVDVESANHDTLLMLGGAYYVTLEGLEKLIKEYKEHLNK